MTDRPQPTPSRHHLWRLLKRTLSKSWDDSIFSESAQASSGRCFRCRHCCSGCWAAWPTSRRCSARTRWPPSSVNWSARRTVCSRRTSSPDHRTDNARHRLGGARRGGVARLRHQPVGRLVGDLGIRRLRGRGPRPNSAPASRAPAVLRAGAVRRHAAVRHRGLATARAGPRTIGAHIPKVGTTSCDSATTRC